MCIFASPFMGAITLVNCLITIYILNFIMKKYYIKPKAKVADLVNPAALLSLSTSEADAIKGQMEGKDRGDYYDDGDAEW